MHAEHNLIFLSLGGSHAHGTANEHSDIDLRGVFVAPLKARLHLRPYSDYEEGKVPLEHELRSEARLRAFSSNVDIEFAYFDIAKFINLLVKNNPNALEILFTDPSEWVLSSEKWRRLYAARFRFLTRQSERRYCGYALAQLKKIRNHRDWLLHPPEAAPRREDFGLADKSKVQHETRLRLEHEIENRIKELRMEDLDLDDATRTEVQKRFSALLMASNTLSDEEQRSRMRAIATNDLSLPVDVIQTLNAERAYDNAKRKWSAFTTWKTERNEARAKLEARFGYDTKHAAHMIRLLRTGLEILRDGNILVKRPDAEEILSIKQGALSYDQLIEEANRTQMAIEAAAKTTSLPRTLDFDKANELAYELMV